MTRPRAQAGLWCIDGDGEIPMVALDDVIGDAPVDAIVLDVEGSEWPALQGASRLIATHRPLIWWEGLQHAAAIELWLCGQGYRRPERGLGADVYSVHASRV